MVEILNNEGTAIPNADAPQSGAEKFRAIGAKIFSTAENFVKRGRGRPRKNPVAFSEIPKIPQPEIKSSPDNPFAAPVSEVSAPDLSAKTYLLGGKAIWKGIFGFFGAKLKRKALRKMSEPKAAQFVAANNANDEEITALGEITGNYLQKLGVQSEYSPLIGMGMIVGTVAIRFQAASKDLDSIPDLP